MKTFLRRTSILVAVAVGGLLVWQTVRDLSTSNKLWEPITDSVE